MLRTKEQTITILVREYKCSKRIKPTEEDVQRFTEELRRLPKKYIDMLEYDLQSDAHYAVRHALEAIRW